MFELKRTSKGYEASFGDFRLSLPSDAELKNAAIDACLHDISDDSPALQILRNCEVNLEMTTGKDAYEQLLGVVIAVDREDAETLEQHDEIYVEMMSAIGLACSHVETERIVVRDDGKVSHDRETAE